MGDSWPSHTLAVTSECSDAVTVLATSNPLFVRTADARMLRADRLRPTSTEDLGQWGDPPPDWVIMVPPSGTTHRATGIGTEEATTASFAVPVDACPVEGLTDGDAVYARPLFFGTEEPSLKRAIRNAQLDVAVAKIPKPFKLGSAVSSPDQQYRGGGAIALRLTDASKRRYLLYLDGVATPNPNDIAPVPGSLAGASVAGGMLRVSCESQLLDKSIEFVAIDGANAAAFSKARLIVRSLDCRV